MEIWQQLVQHEKKYKKQKKAIYDEINMTSKYMYV